MAVGIICEYNPFHNGHLYHIREIQRQFPREPIILVLSGPFLERGDVSLLTKWEKTEIALRAGVDLIVELPFAFASQSADLFAKGAIQILNALRVDKLVFGSELGNTDILSKQARIQLENSYQETFKNLLKQGKNYPTALSEALRENGGIEITEPNDILGVSYIREILKNHYPITPTAIKRTNSYHDLSLTGSIVSASAIRKALRLHRDITPFVPSFVLPYLQKPLFFKEDYFPLFQYKVWSDIDNLSKFQTVDEGIENRIRKYAFQAVSYDDFIMKLKTKRTTYNKLSRMMIHILVGFTKEEAKLKKNVEFLRILGFSAIGKQYLHDYKDKITLPIITNYAGDPAHRLALEFKVNTIYAAVYPPDQRKAIIEQEYHNPPIDKEKLP